MLKTSIHGFCGDLNLIHVDPLVLSSNLYNGYLYMYQVYFFYHKMEIFFGDIFVYWLASKTTGEVCFRDNLSLHLAHSDHIREASTSDASTVVLSG